MQWFLYINLFVIGVVVTLAIQHAYAHFHQKPDRRRPHLPDRSLHLPNATRDQLLEQASEEFETMLDHAREELARDLTTTTKRLDQQLAELGASVIDTEIKQTKTTLDALRQQSETTLQAIEADMQKQQQALASGLNDYQTKLFGKLGDEAAQAQANLAAELDAKLSDAVASFLTETLRHNVDLGAQMPYLLATLEEHKAELIAEVANGA